MKRKIPKRRSTNDLQPDLVAIIAAQVELERSLVNMIKSPQSFLAETNLAEPLVAERAAWHELALPRILLVAQQRHSSAIDEAIRRYKSALKDQERIIDLDVEDENLKKTLINVIGRYEVYHRRDLNALEVTIMTPEVGEPFDPECHVSVGTVPCTELEQNGKLAEVVSPAFKWFDKDRVSQLQAAEVLIFEVGTDPIPRTTTVE